LDYAPFGIFPTNPIYKASLLAKLELGAFERDCETGSYRKKKAAVDSKVDAQQGCRQQTAKTLFSTHPKLRQLGTALFSRREAFNNFLKLLE
jgi:hypothetical protein